MPGAEADELVKTLTVRHVGVVFTQVPLAENPCPVAGRMERLRECGLFGPHGFFAGGDSVRACSDVVAARQQACPGRRTNRRDVEARELDALRRQTVLNRRFDQRVPVRGQIAVSLIVGHDQQNIGLSICGSGRAFSTAKVSH